MRSRYDAERSAAAAVVLGNSHVFLTIAVLLAIAFGILSQHSTMVYASALIIALVATVSILTSLRIYNPWVSWTGWFVPMLLFGLVMEPVRTGIIALFTVFFAYALAGVLMFAFFTVGRGRLTKWVTTGV